MAGLRLGPEGEAERAALLENAARAWTVLGGEASIDLLLPDASIAIGMDIGSPASHQVWTSARMIIESSLAKEGQPGVDVGRSLAESAENSRLRAEQMYWEEVLRVTRRALGALDRDSPRMPGNLEIDEHEREFDPDCYEFVLGWVEGIGADREAWMRTLGGGLQLFKEQLGPAAATDYDEAAKAARGALARVQSRTVNVYENAARTIEVVPRIQCCNRGDYLKRNRGVFIARARGPQGSWNVNRLCEELTRTIAELEGRASNLQSGT